ncbi:MAG TPA: hypothetical protein PKA53_07505 [Sphingobacterium sp.]|nr:hypothetical protein [Sphingobacterium sp.]
MVGNVCPTIGGSPTTSTALQTVGHPETSSGQAKTKQRDRKA